jgi:2-oxoisovalerate dehydrogenase E1 component alpha subunit
MIIGSLRNVAKRFTARSLSSVAQGGKDYGIYAGVKVPFVRSLDDAVVKPENNAIWPAYRLIDNEGKPVDDSKEMPHIALDLSEETLVEFYKTMLKLRAMDQIFYDAQRQGRISFYMTNSGEEATHIGSAYAVDDDDMVYGQYREAGVLMWRGFTLQQFADQCFSNSGDPAKGRQMPIHYGSVEHNFQTISSPLTTQLPQAAGAAYAYKLAKNGKIVVCYFGDGAASEGDFHPALNMSTTLECPMIFFCRNNGYAISTPVQDQYRGDGIVSRGPGYGMASLRIDGNDVFAVYEATKYARELAIRESRPVLIEAMTYRQGHHSTSDDSTRYRGIDEIQDWQKNNDPALRLKNYIKDLGCWNDELDVACQKDMRKQVLKALSEAETKEKAPASSVFEDVYYSEDGKLPQALALQEKQMNDHIAKYPDHYHLGH